MSPAGQAIGATDTATEWTWPTPVTSMEWEVMVEREVVRGPDGEPTSGYYYTHQFWFQEGVVGFLGIQAEGGYNSEVGTEYDFTKIAVFWLSGPPTAGELGDIPFPRARVLPETAAGVNYLTIHARFDWQVCHVYRFRLAPHSMEPNGDIWYGAWIEDVDSGDVTFLGRMLLPQDIGPLATFSSSRTLGIEFPGTTSCDVPQPASVLYGIPRSAEGDVVASLESNRFEYPLLCAGSRFTTFEGAVRHELSVR